MLGTVLDNGKGLRADVKMTFTCDCGRVSLVAMPDMEVTRLVCPWCSPSTTPSKVGPTLRLVAK